MANKKRGQIGVEYLIVVGFVTFAIISIIALAFFYSNEIKDRIRLNQVESFTDQLISSSENIFFAGEPSKTTVRLYLPEGVDGFVVNGNTILVTVKVSGGQNIREYESNVPLSLSGGMTLSEGLKKLTLEAYDDRVEITQA